MLNRSIIVKHNVRPGRGRSGLAPRRFNSTKVIFPFDPDDLGLGGQYMFVDQPDFEHRPRPSHLDYGDPEPMTRDIEVLRILDGLPTLDPFLLREVLARKSRIEVDSPATSAFSEPDKAHMMGFVESQINRPRSSSASARCAEGDTRAKRLSQLLLAEHDSPELEPLQLTLAHGRATSSPRRCSPGRPSSTTAGAVARPGPGVEGDDALVWSRIEPRAATTAMACAS